MVTPDAKRKAVAHLTELHQVSQRRACSALNVDRSMVRYQSRRADDAGLRDAIKAVARKRRRFDYRRLQVMVQRQGWQVNHKKFRRIYRQEKLQVHRRGGKDRAPGSRRPMVVPHGSHKRWSLDFVIDALIGGRRFRIIAVVVDHTRENLALHRAGKTATERVHREFQWQAARRMPQRKAFQLSLMTCATGVANAALDCIPMMVIAGDIPTHYYGKHPHQEVNLHADAAQWEIYRPIMKRAWCARCSVIVFRYTYEN